MKVAGAEYRLWKGRSEPVLVMFGSSEVAGFKVHCQRKVALEFSQFVAELGPEIGIFYVMNRAAEKLCILLIRNYSAASCSEMRVIVHPVK